MQLNEISYAIRGCAFEVFKELGPGLMESVYVNALLYELTLQGLSTSAQVAVPVIYKNCQLDLGFRIDILVEERVIVEVKSVEVLHPVHSKQVLTYLKLTDRRLGILINFNVAMLEDKKSIVRLLNGDPTE